MGKKKTNPNKIPRTQADCDREYHRGLTDGAVRSVVICLWTMVDAFHASEEQIKLFERELRYNLDSIAKGSAKLGDLARALREEYHLEVEFTDGEETEKEKSGR